MSLTLRQLRYFVAVAEAGRISHAALKLNISQSAITTAIRELEDSLRQILFERLPHGVELTRSGRRFLAHAYTVLGAVDNAMSLSDEHADVQGELIIAASYTVMGYFLPHHLQRFEQLYPGIRIKVHEVSRERIEEGLVSQSYDMGVLLTSNVMLNDLQQETVVHSQRRLWVPADHPLLKQEEVRLADVAQQPYIMLTIDEADATTMKYWNKTALEPAVRLSTSSVEAVRSMVGLGYGVTILSDMVYRPWSLEGRRIKTVNLRDPVPSMDIGLCWKRDSLTAAMSAFRDYFRSVVQAPALPRASGSSAPSGS